MALYRDSVRPYLDFLQYVAVTWSIAQVQRQSSRASHLTKDGQNDSDAQDVAVLTPLLTQVARAALLAPPAPQVLE